MHWSLRIKGSENQCSIWRHPGITWGRFKHCLCSIDCDRFGVGASLSTENFKSLTRWFHNAAKCENHSLRAAFLKVGPSDQHSYSILWKLGNAKPQAAPHNYLIRNPESGAQQCASTSPSYDADAHQSLRISHLDLRRCFQKTYYLIFNPSPWIWVSVF